MPLRRVAIFLAVGLALAAAVASSASARIGSSSVCPGNFQVLSNDSVGSLSLPAGPYAITVSRRLTCVQASTLFATFLKQWTGDLPDGWTVAGNGFKKGAMGFTVAPNRTRTTVPPTSGAKVVPAKLTCPGTFSVLHEDTIGRASFPAGNYALQLLRSSSALTCQDVGRQFALFLGQYSSGRLPSPWSLNAATKTFGTRSGLGFRAVALPGGTQKTSGGGETQGTLCRARYTVASDMTRIDNFVFDKGTYSIWAIGGLTCDQAAKDVARLVALRTSLPSGWKHDVPNAIITVGDGEGLRLKLEDQTH